MKELLRAEDLDLGYNGQIVVGDIDFPVYEGDYLFVIGDNGSGKTTLMKTLLSLIRPVSGMIVFSDRLKKSDIGYLPQVSQMQEDFPATVDEVIMSGFQGKSFWKTFYTAEEKNRAQAVKEEMGIQSLGKRSFHELSGGQKQRVLLSRALCAAEKLLVMDEPVSGLDQEATAEFYSLVNKLNGKGMAIVMISHDHAAVERYAKNVLLISDSVFYGSREEYLKRTVMKNA